MKFFYHCLPVALALISLSGCGGNGENGLATEGATMDELAKYEAELAATNSEAGYEDIEVDE